MQLARFEQYDQERLRIASDNSDINDSEEEGEIAPSLYMDRKWKVITNPNVTSYGQLTFQECGFIAPQKEAEILLTEISDEDLQLIDIGAVFY